MTPINEDKVDDVCKLGQGKDCCRYLGAAGVGFICLKFTDRAYLDARVATNTMTAQGDNCRGEDSSGVEADRQFGQPHYGHGEHDESEGGTHD